MAAPDPAVAIFKAAWHLADAKGEVGHRTEAGIQAVRAFLSAAVADSAKCHPESGSLCPGCEAARIVRGEA